MAFFFFSFFFSFFLSFFLSFHFILSGDFSLIDDHLPGYATGNMQIVKGVGNYFIITS